MSGFYDHFFVLPYAPLTKRESLIAFALMASAFKIRYNSVTLSFGRSPPTGIRSQSI